MSGAYSLEPITHGKVILKTSFGDVEIELWPREAPRAVRNFLQHIVDGYYNGTIFHRIVPEFVIQGGDPTGTGFGGESIYDGGKAFPAEFHQRLRFTHRGIVAMAGADKDDNRSQFFITLAPCPELDRNHTIFGKVTGNTIYNVLEASKLELSKDDPERPVHPPLILSAEVIVNPFEEMAPNPVAVAAIAARRAAAANANANAYGKSGDARSRPGRAGVARRNTTLLSFADDEGNEDNDDLFSAGTQKKFKMTAPPNFVKRRTASVRERKTSTITSTTVADDDNKVQHKGKEVVQPPLHAKVEKVESGNNNSNNDCEKEEKEGEEGSKPKAKVFKLAMNDPAQKKETIFDFGPKEKKRRKKVNESNVLEKMQRFKSGHGKSDLRQHTLVFNRGEDELPKDEHEDTE